MQPRQFRNQPMQVAALVATQLSVACGGLPQVDVITDFADRAGHYTVSTFQTRVRGWVPYTVYLPPSWSDGGDEAYPLIIFLHGQGGDEHTFAAHVDADTLNQWIAGGLVPPFVLIAPRGQPDPAEVHWTDRENVQLLTSDGQGSLRAFAKATFSAGGTASLISVHGQSRGATGALNLILQRPDRFASVSATSFVSDYAVEDLAKAARQNAERLRGSGVRLRMTIGAEDPYVVQRGRTASSDLHALLQDLDIPHDYEVMPGAGHHFGQLWQAGLSNGQPAGLRDVRFHASAWAAPVVAP